MLTFYVLSIMLTCLCIIFTIAAAFDGDFDLMKILIIFTAFLFCCVLSLSPDKIESKKRLVPTYKITVNENNIADTTFVYKEIWE